jgi:hypothetical protein
MPFLVLFLLSCTGMKTDRVDSAIKLMRGIGDAIIRIDGLQAVRKYAPELEPILNPDGDMVITLAEIEAAAEAIMADPEMSALLLATAIYLHKRGQ